MSAVQRVAVIAGAGPAGLTAAWELLARTDVHPVVIEPTAAIGGLAQTYVYHGNRIDIGGHRFFSKSERVMNWWLGILPRQGAPAADDVRFGHDVELVPVDSHFERHFPSPAESADNKDYVNHIRLNTQTIPIPSRHGQGCSVLGRRRS